MSIPALKQIVLYCSTHMIKIIKYDYVASSDRCASSSLLRNAVKECQVGDPRRAHLVFQEDDGGIFYHILPGFYYGCCAFFMP